MRAWWPGAPLVALLVALAGAPGCSIEDFHPRVDGGMDGAVCTDTQGDPRNCGRCGHDCTTLPHVVASAATCVAGRCHVEAACEGGRAHCTATDDDGCETDVSTRARCGACFNAACSEPNPECVPPGTPGGDGGTPLGVPGYHCGNSCGALARCPTGCVDLQTSAINCGACGNVCAPAPNATATCAGGHCGFLCAPGFGDCDGNPATGCEASTQSSTANCGACGNVCPSRANAAVTCTGGVCGFGCAPGFGDCNGVAADGCETDLHASAANCGACGTACAAHANGVGACVAGTGGTSACGLRCNAGFGDCNNVVADGCEADVTTSVANCGGCGTAFACPVRPFASATCAGGTCGIACMTGHGNCDGDPLNGCETDTTRSVVNCGRCGNECPVPPMADVATCTASACGFHCPTGRAHCDGVAAHGCETDTANDPHNCMTCGNVCTNCVASHCF